LPVRGVLVDGGFSLSLVKMRSLLALNQIYLLHKNVEVGFTFLGRKKNLWGIEMKLLDGGFERVHIH
jgi:hypothetical protein